MRQAWWVVLSFVAMLAVAAPAMAVPDQGSPLAVRIMSYGKFQDAAWTHLPEIGVHYIFLPVPAPDQVDAIMQKLKDHKLTALVLRGDTDLSKETAPEQLGAQAAICEKMGVHYMFLSAKRNDAPKELVLERLRKSADIAKTYNVTITLETHPDLCTNADLQLETMKALNHSNVRVNFDTGNISFYNKGLDAAAELKKVVHLLGTVELKDHNLELESWNFPVLGTGKVNFPSILQTLREHAYTGPITIEFEGTKGVELNEEQTKQAIAQSVAYLKTLAQFR
jgi:sugar phosphate isomerase/epimerase